MDFIPFNDNIRVIIFSMGAISTKEILTDLNYKKLIHSVGMKSMALMKENFSVQNFLNVCSSFLEKTDLLSKLKLLDLKVLIQRLYEYNNTTIRNFQKEKQFDWKNRSQINRCILVFNARA